MWGCVCVCVCVEGADEVDVKKGLCGFVLDRDTDRATQHTSMQHSYTDTQHQQSLCKGERETHVAWRPRVARVTVHDQHHGLL